MALMNQVFHDCLDKFVVVFIDDILVYLKDVEEHKKHLRKVLEILREKKLYTKYSKCEYLLDEVSFKVYIVSKEAIKVDLAKVEAVRNWHTSKNVTYVRSFIGLDGYY